MISFHNIFENNKQLIKISLLVCYITKMNFTQSFAVSLH